MGCLLREADEALILKELVPLPVFIGLNTSLALPVLPVELVVIDVRLEKANVFKGV